jgi:hypothetical protein
MVSHTHNVCAKDVYVAIVSTIIETDRPEMEIAPGLQLLGPIYQKFVPGFRSHSLLTYFTGLCLSVPFTPRHLLANWTIFSSLAPMTPVLISKLLSKT